MTSKNICNFSQSQMQDNLRFSVSFQKWRRGSTARAATSAGCGENQNFTLVFATKNHCSARHDCNLACAEIHAYCMHADGNNLIY